MSARKIEAHAGKFPGSSTNASGHSPFNAKPAQKVSRETFSGVPGKSYNRPEYNDFYYATKAQSPDDEADLLAEVAFGEEAENRGDVIFKTGCGHIKALSYNIKFHMLKVWFVKGAVVVYSKVPEAVAGELLYLAETKTGRVDRRAARRASRTARYTGRESTLDSKMVHDLGLRFWDLVRIRGKVHGSQYPFRYVKGNVSVLTGSNQRYKMTLSDEMLKDITGIEGSVPNGITLELAISEKDLQSLLAENRPSNTSKLGVRNIATIDKDGTYKEIEAGGVDQDYYNSDRPVSSFKPRDIQGTDYELELMKKVTKAKDDYNSNLDTEINQYSFGKIYELARKAGFSDTDIRSYVDAAIKVRKGETFTNMKEIIDSIEARARQLGVPIDLSAADYRYSDITDKRYNYPARKKSADNITLAKLVDAGLLSATERADIISFDKQHSIRTNAKATLSHIYRTGKRVWTKQELRDFANYKVPGNISASDKAAYDKYIDNEDWIGALSFLKGRQHPVEGINNKSGKVTTIRVPYAGENDSFAGE